MKNKCPLKHVNVIPASQLAGGTMTQAEPNAACGVGKNKAFQEVRLHAYTLGTTDLLKVSYVEPDSFHPWHWDAAKELLELSTGKYVDSNRQRELLERMATIIAKNDPNT